MWRKRSGALEAGCALQRDEGVGAESGSGNTSAASKRGSISGIGFMDPLYCNSGNIDQDYCDPCTEYFHSFPPPLSLYANALRTQAVSGSSTIPTRDRKSVV